MFEDIRDFIENNSYREDVHLIFKQASLNVCNSSIAKKYNLAHAHRLLWLLEKSVKPLRLYKKCAIHNCISPSCHTDVQPSDFYSHRKPFIHKNNRLKVGSREFWKMDEAGLINWKTYHPTHRITGAIIDKL